MNLLTLSKDFLEFFNHKIYLIFLTQAWAFPLLYPSSRIFVMRSVYWWSREEIAKCSTFLFWRSCRGCGLCELVGSSCIEFLREFIIEVRPRRACVCCSCGNKWGTAGPRVLEGARCRCCGTNWSCRINFSENLSLRWRRGYRASGSNLEIILPCLRLLISPSLICVYISCMLLLLTSLYVWYTCA